MAGRNTHEFHTSSSARLTIDASGHSTFAGEVSTNGGRIRLRNDSIENFESTSDDAAIVFNYNGYQGGTSAFRDVAIFNGKHDLVSKFDGSSKLFDHKGAATFEGNVSVGGADPSNSSGIKCRTDGIFESYVTADGNTAIAIKRGGTVNTRIKGGGDAYFKGNVGIGQENPAAKLDVAGNQLFSAANPQIQFNAGGPIIRLHEANTIAFLSDSTNERMRLTSDGKLGLGTSAPNHALTLNKDSGACFIETAGGGYTAGTSSVYYGQDTGGEGYFWNRGNNDILFGTNNTQRLRIAADGTATLAGQLNSASVTTGT